MNTLYIRATGLSLSLLALLPISATVPNGNDVLMTIKGESAITTQQLQKKMNDIASRMTPEKRALLRNGITNVSFADSVLLCMKVAQLARLYVQDNQLKENSLSKAITAGIEIITLKDAQFAINSKEKESVHHCVLLGMKFAQLIGETKIIAQMTNAIPEETVNQAYQEVLQKLAQYNISDIPTEEEIKPYIKLVITCTNPMFFTQVERFRKAFIDNLKNKYQMSENEEVQKQFMHGQAKGI
jgi:hypothetical protein